jgi:hypothetical protein
MLTDNEQQRRRTQMRVKTKTSRTSANTTYGVVYYTFLAICAGVPFGVWMESALAGFTLTNILGCLWLLAERIGRQKE